MSKEIRILTGLHAGARMTLQPGRHHVGGGAAADIRVSDWDAPPLCLHIAEDGRAETGPTEGEAAASPLPDLEPRRFGGVILAVGAVDAPWPSDMALIERVLGPAIVPAAAAAPARRVPSLGAVVRWTALCGAMLIGVTVSATQLDRRPPPATPPTPLDLLPRLSAALEAEAQLELSLSADEAHVKVKGLVATPADLAAVRHALERIVPGKVRTEITVINDVLENLQVTLRDPGLRARYLGGGVFEVSGRTPRPERVQGLLEKIRLDLGTNVTRVDVAIEPEGGESLPRNTNAAVSTGDVSYTETTDGTKHFFPDGPLLAIR